MFRTTFYFFILFTCMYINAQENLIVNGSFEDYSSCPTGNDLGDGQFQRCTGWWYSNPFGIGSPDYYNRCATSIVGIPNNFWGYQEAYDGDGYVGLGLCEWWTESNIIFGRELIQSKLKTTLSPCTKYSLKMMLNLANKSEYKFQRLGVIFSSDSLYHNNMIQFNSVYLDPIYYDMSDIDTIDWIELNGLYTANGNENFISIGFFEENLDNDTIPFNLSQAFNTTDINYILIDNIELISEHTNEECYLDFPNTFTPNQDGVNDIVDLSFLINYYDLEILNRWGNVVYSSIDGSHFWDGTSQNGIPCSTGVYFYQIKNKKTYKNIKSGFIHLIR